MGLYVSGPLEKPPSAKNKKLINFLIALIQIN